jgi:membrane protein DedA with SNARE-associated domain
VNRYGWGSFLFYNAAGGIVWATVFGLGGYVFGEAVHRFTGPIGIIALVGVIVGIGISWWVVRRQEERMEERILTEEQEKQRFED